MDEEPQAKREPQNPLLVVVKTLVQQHHDLVQLVLILVTSSQGGMSEADRAEIAVQTKLMRTSTAELRDAVNRAQPETGG